MGPSIYSYVADDTTTNPDKPAYDPNEAPFLSNVSPRRSHSIVTASPSHFAFTGRRSAKKNQPISGTSPHFPVESELPSLANISPRFPSGSSSAGAKPSSSLSSSTSSGLAEFHRVNLPPSCSGCFCVNKYLLSTRSCPYSIQSLRTWSGPLGTNLYNLPL